jgi:hypothetical protein
MNPMTSEQRQHLAQMMLPKAANLAVLVHGEGGPEDIAEILAGLDETQKNALIVVLAGMVDLERPVGKGLNWVAVTKNAALPVDAWMEQRPLREHAPVDDEGIEDDFVDWAAVDRFMKGFRVDLTDADFLAAVQECVGLGMSLGDVDRLRRWPAKTAENWVNRLRKRYRRHDRQFPNLASATREFTEAEVVEIRERSARGMTDLSIGMSFDCSPKAVAAICRGRRYAKFGGPIRGARNAKDVPTSREFMCGHADDSLAGRKKHRLGTAA